MNLSRGSQSELSELILSTWRLIWGCVQGHPDNTSGETISSSQSQSALATFPKILQEKRTQKALESEGPAEEALCAEHEKDFLLRSRGQRNACFGKQRRIIKSLLRKNTDVTPPQKVPGKQKNPATPTREVQSQPKVIGRSLIVWLWSNRMWILRVISNYRVFIPTTQRELICTRQPGPKIMKLMRSIKAKLLGKGKNVIIYIETETSPHFLAFPPVVPPFPAL